MGGRNALEFAAHFSQRVKALVLEDIGPEANFAAVERIERLLSLVPTPFHCRSDAKDFFEKQYPQKISFYPQPEVVSRFFLSNIEPKPDGTQDWRFDKEAILKSMVEGRNEDRWDELANLKMPVLIVRGEKSQDLPRPVYERMLATLPAAKGAEIPGAGHWVHFEQPALFIRVLKEFFHEVL
jgi:pimeloyl-ACP methyl ester carboxylesterase